MTNSQAKILRQVIQYGQALVFHINRSKTPNREYKAAKQLELEGILKFEDSKPNGLYKVTLKNLHIYKA